MKHEEIRQAIADGRIKAGSTVWVNREKEGVIRTERPEYTQDRFVKVTGNNAWPLPSEISLADPAAPPALPPPGTEARAMRAPFTNEFLGIQHGHDGMAMRAPTPEIVMSDVRRNLTIISKAGNRFLLRVHDDGTLFTEPEGAE